MANPDLRQPKKLYWSISTKMGRPKRGLFGKCVWKSWYHGIVVESCVSLGTSLDAACWQRLIFPDVDTEIDLGNQGFWNSDNEIEALVGRKPELFRFGTLMRRFERGYQIDHNCFSETKFIKFVVDCSRGQGTFLRLPPFCENAALKHVADVCHGLKGLSLHHCLLIFSVCIILELIGKCNQLELLSLRGGSHNLKETLLQISIHCKNFCRLHVSNAVISREDSSAIVNLVSNIKWLSLRRSYIHRDNLVMLLQRTCAFGCEGDVVILELASHIDKFRCEGSRNGDALSWVV